VRVQTITCLVSIPYPTNQLQIHNGCVCHQKNSQQFCSHVSISYLFFLLLLSSLLLPSLSLSLPLSLNHCSLMEPLDDSDSKLERVDSDRTSTSSASGISSVFSTDDFRNFNSSGDISSISSGSGEIPTCTVNRVILAPPLIAMSNEAYKNEPAAPEEVVVTAVVREKCVGMNNKGLSWGHTSVIGRRKEMEDAVAVIPGFMSRTCDHVGGCTAPGSRSSGEISPIHFFGVYDGHGGAQVHTFFHFYLFIIISKNNSLYFIYYYRILCL